MAANTVISLILKAKDEASSVLTGATAKIAGLMAAFAGGVAINKALEDMTELDKAAQRLAISTESLSAGQAAAFRIAGIEAEDYNDLLKEVAVKIEEFSSINAGGAIDFFEIMQVNVKDFIKLNPQEQFLKMADAMKDMSVSAQRAFADQIGSDIFTNMLPAIREGGDAFRDAMKEAEKFKLVTSSFDAKAVRDLKSEIGLVGMVANSTFQKMFSSVAPDLTIVVQVVRDKMLEMLGYVSDNQSNISKAFSGAILKILEFADTLLDTKNSGAGLFLEMKEKALEFSLSFIKAFQKISDGVGRIWEGVVNTTNKAMSDMAQTFADKILPLAATAGDMFGFEQKAQEIRALSAQMRENAEDMRSKLVSYNPIDTSSAQKFINDQIDANKKLIQQEVERNKLNKNNLSLAEAYSKKLAERKNSVKTELEDRAAKDEVSLQKGGDAKFNAANATAAAAVANSAAKLRADLAKADIENTIKTIETKKAIELAGLEEKARAEGISANDVAKKRLDIELESARKISALKKKAIDEDIKALEVQIQGQQAILATESVDAGRGGAISAIKELEAEIVRKRQEQKQIGADLIAQSAILKANRAAELGTLKAELEQIKEEAELELRVIRGDSVDVELEKLDKQWKDTVRDMEEVGVDSTAVKDLLSAKKAEIELNDIENKFADLKKKLETNKISPFEYLKEVGELEKKGTEKTAEVGNPERADKFAEAAKEAKAEVFELESIMEKVGDSMTSGFENAFSELISGSKSAKEAFSDMAQSVLMDIGKIIAKLVIQLAYQSMISALSGGGSSAAGAGGGGGGLMSSLSGLIGSLPKFHTGGISGKGADNYGLNPDEALIVAQKGEEIITEKDPRHRKNAGKGGSSGAAPSVNVVNMLDNNAIAKSTMEHPSFESTVLNVIRSNPEIVRSV